MDQLARPDVEATGLNCENRRRTEGLPQEKSVVVEQPFTQPLYAARVKSGRDPMNRLEGVEQVDLHSLENVLPAAQPEQVLLPPPLGVNDLPGQH